MAASTSPRKHRVIVAVVLALALITGFFAMFSVWANRQALNTDNWENTSSQLLANKNIQNAVGAYLVNELFTSVDVPAELQKLLPPQAAPLAGPAAGALRQVADRAAPRLLARPRVQDAWRTANRAAHRQLLQVINGGSDAVSTQNGDVVLNLRPLVDDLASSLGVESQVAAARSKLQGKAGAGARATAEQKLGLTLPGSTGRLVIMKSDQLATSQDVAKAIRGLAVVLTGLSLALFALAVFLAGGWRRVALRRVGWSFIALGLLVLIGRRVIGNQVVDGLVANSSIKPAVHSTWTIGTSLLYAIAIAMFAYGVLFVLAAWLAGPTGSAAAVRRALAPSMRDRLAVVYGSVAVVFLLVILWGPTPATRKPLGIALFAALLILGIEVLRRQVGREFPDAQAGDTMARMKERSRRDKQPERVDELERLAALHDRGAISDKEFDSQKVLILNGS